jgi:hypothetical protein
MRTGGSCENKHMFKITKIPIKNLMARTITWTRKGKAKERPKRRKARRNQRRERGSPACGRELSHMFNEKKRETSCEL